jgi:hypothetical protein
MPLKGDCRGLWANTCVFHAMPSPGLALTGMGAQNLSSTTIIATMAVLIVKRICGAGGLDRVD